MAKEVSGSIPPGAFQEMDFVPRDRFSVGFGLRPMRRLPQGDFHVDEPQPAEEAVVIHTPNGEVPLRARRAQAFQRLSAGRLTAAELGDALAEEGKEYKSTRIQRGATAAFDLGSFLRGRQAEEQVVKGPDGRYGITNANEPVTYEPITASEPVQWRRAYKHQERRVVEALIRGDDTSTILTTLWPDVPPEQSVKRLRPLVSRIRGSLPEGVSIRGTIPPEGTGELELVRSIFGSGTSLTEHTPRSYSRGDTVSETQATRQAPQRELRQAPQNAALPEHTDKHTPRLTHPTSNYKNLTALEKEMLVAHERGVSFTDLSDALEMPLDDVRRTIAQAQMKSMDETPLADSKTAHEVVDFRFDDVAHEADDLGYGLDVEASVVEESVYEEYGRRRDDSHID